LGLGAIVVGFLAWTAVYGVLSLLAHNFAAVSDGITVLWPAGGVALYLMLRYGLRQPLMGLGPILVGGVAAAAASAVAEGGSAGSFFTEAFLVLAGAAGATAGAAAYRFFEKSVFATGDVFSHPRGMIVLLAAGCETFALTSGVVGTVVLHAAQALRGMGPFGGPLDLVTSFVPWFIGDLASSVLVTPALIAWCRPGQWGRPPVPVLVLWGLTVAAAAVALLVELPAIIENAAVLLLIGPALAAAAFNSQPRFFCVIVLTSASLTLAVVASHGNTPFMAMSVMLLLAQLYILTISSTQFVLYATVAESRRSTAERLNLARHFSPNMVELVARLGRPFAKPQKLPATILFCDIRNFTGFSEAAGPEATMELLRDFHTAMARVIFAHHGTLDRFLGDGLMAVFGMPEPRADDTLRALACAFAMQEAMARLNEERRARGQPTVAMGVGIHKGDVMLGDIGGEQALAITVVGDTVNAASRLQVLCRAHDAALIISREALEAAKGDEGAAAHVECFAKLTPLGRTLLRGRIHETEIWGVPLNEPVTEVATPAGIVQSLARST
jgi:class 3 adenylate cyclase